MPTEMQATNQSVKKDDRVRIFLQPIASPWVLGLYGYTVAAFVMGGQYAGWFSSAGAKAMVYVAIASLLGGFAQYISALWAFKARDVLGTAFNGIWGIFWLSVGFFSLYVSQTATTTSAMPAAPIAASIGSIEMGFFFIPMALITAAIAAASFSHSKALVAALCLLTLATILMTIGLLAGSAVLQMIGGWCFVISSAFAWYNSSLVLIANSFAKGRARAQIKEAQMVNEGLGEPGVVHDIGTAMPNAFIRQKAAATAATANE
ncbi:MAG: GPR1/FUN34/YaaH family transporter [Desulfobacterales bacterium]|jgi:succinate-acetate transporter protein